MKRVAKRNVYSRNISKQTLQSRKFVLVGLWQQPGLITAKVVVRYSFGATLISTLGGALCIYRSTPSKDGSGSVRGGNSVHGNIMCFAGSEIVRAAGALEESGRDEAEERLKKKNSDNKKRQLCKSYHTIPIPTTTSPPASPLPTPITATNTTTPPPPRSWPSRTHKVGRGLLSLLSFVPPLRSALQPPLPSPPPLLLFSSTGCPSTFGRCSVLAFRPPTDAQTLTSQVLALGTYGPGHINCFLAYPLTTRPVPTSPVRCPGRIPSLQGGTSASHGTKEPSGFSGVRSFATLPIVEDVECSAP
ncbi:hypothetical protein E2C01_042398 [Portunus trituberculatus]|uniref:Uncharacterized protein n=1 Tax=Portunus trituberculatus TaxID=210409 RepID=A0A5B7FUP9_PORTR|nr:hypothetical protein [Portunus trituberculatus]